MAKIHVVLCRLGEWSEQSTEVVKAYPEAQEHLAQAFVLDATQAYESKRPQYDKLQGERPWNNTDKQREVIAAYVADSINPHSGVSVEHVQQYWIETTELVTEEN
jgi:hypothetical protein